MNPSPIETAVRSLACLALLVFTLTACSSDSGFTTAGDAGDASGSDTTESDANDANDATEDATADAETDASLTFDEAAVFFECERDDDCTPFGDREQLCVERVCVIPPTTSAQLADDEADDPTLEPDATIALGCYEGASLYEPAGEDALVTVDGVLERFGSGPPTTNLCVTLYDEDVLLPWMVRHECNGLAEDADDDDYVGCWQLDPCRCDEHFGDAPTSVNQPLVDAANVGLEEAERTLRVEDLASCYAYVGWCDAIDDDALRATCAERVSDLSLSSATNLVLGSTRSVDDPVDREREEPEGTSLFSIDNVPTNVRVTIKVSGREVRWRDTWEYGLFTRGDLVVDGVFRTDANVVSDGAWETIPPAVGRPNADDRNGAVAGVVRDCGAEARNPWAIVHATVGIAFNQGSVLAYFNGNPDDRLPLPSRVDTNLLGTFAAIDLPAGPNRVAPVICAGDCTDRDNLVFAGGKNVFQTPKSVIIATFEGYFLP